MKTPFATFKQEQARQYLKFCQFIYQVGESSLLRQKSVPIKRSEINSPSFQKELAYLKECLLKYRQITGHGRGITAVQVGILKRFSVIFTDQGLLVIINPKILGKAKQSLRYPEMCMSTFPLIAPVVRPAWIEFEYLDEQGHLQHWDAKSQTAVENIMNRVFQHEFDHMDGIINIDYVKANELIFESDPSFYENAHFEEVT